MTTVIVLNRSQVMSLFLLKCFNSVWLRVKSEVLIIACRPFKHSDSTYRCSLPSLRQPNSLPGAPQRHQAYFLAWNLCTCPLSLSEYTFHIIFFCSTSCLTSFRPLLKYSLSTEALPHSYDIEALISCQIFFSILLSPHNIQHLIIHLFSICSPNKM